MIIKDSVHKKWRKKSSVSQRKKITLLKSIFLFGILAFLISASIILSNNLKTKGYAGLWDFLKVVSENYWNGRNATTENVSIEIKEKDIKILEKNREKALERGVIINDLDGQYVSGTLQFKGQKMKVKLRLKGHMTDHLQNNKWSFRIKINDKSTFMGMKRFSFQHPGTRGYIYEWIYHELMKREGIIALRYKFINVTVNGKDWGVYAVEENFESELIANNNRPEGPIIRFNPDLYWVDRFNEMKKTKVTSEFASYFSSNSEAYRENQILKDSVQRAYYLKALALIEGLRNRKILVDEAFNIPMLARFHAIIDLVGGQQSLDWSDIKYYFNPVSNRLEPISYESFTHFPVTELSGMYKFVNIDSSENYKDWHQLLFSNPVFFRAYVKELERIIAPAYLDTFFYDIRKELLLNQAILNKEFPYKKFDEKEYYKNQMMINTMLDAPKSFYAYYKNRNENQIYLQIGSIESLPIQIKSLQLGETLFAPLNEIILPSKQPDSFVEYHEYAFQAPKDFQCNDSTLALLKVNYSVLGASETKQEKIFPFSYPDPESLNNNKVNQEGNLNKFSFLIINEPDKLIYIRNGVNTISSDLLIPSGYKVVAGSGTILDIKNNSRIISGSPFIFNGEDEAPIIITSSDLSGQGIKLLCAENSKFRYVEFKKLKGLKTVNKSINGAVCFYKSPVSFVNCNFTEIKQENAVNLIYSDFLFTDCLFQELGGNAIMTDFSNGKLLNSVFENCNGIAVQGTRGGISLKNVLTSFVNKGLEIKTGCQIKGNNLKFKNASIAIASENGGTAELKDIVISDSGIALLAKNENGKNASNLIVSNIIMKGVKKNIEVDHQSTIKCNGNVFNNDFEKK